VVNGVMDSRQRVSVSHTLRGIYLNLTPLFALLSVTVPGCGSEHCGLAPSARPDQSSCVEGSGHTPFFDDACPTGSRSSTHKIINGSGPHLIRSFPSSSLTLRLI